VQNVSHRAPGRPPVGARQIVSQQDIVPLIRIDR
jgi:hypothetical protein